MSPFWLRLTAVLLAGFLMACHDAAPFEDPGGSTLLYGVAANWQFSDSMVVELLIWPATGGLVPEVLSSGAVGPDGSFFLAMPPPPSNTLDTVAGVYTAASAQGGIPFSVSYKLRVRAKGSWNVHGWLVQSSPEYSALPRTSQYLANFVYVDRPRTVFDTTGGWWRPVTADAMLSTRFQNNQTGWAYTETTWTRRSLNLRLGWNCVVHRFLGESGRTSSYSINVENYPGSTWQYYDINQMTKLPFQWRRLP